MALPSKVSRRNRYNARRHELAQRPAPLPVVPPTTDWKARPGDTVAHAYASTAGWMRSACRALPWTVLLVDGSALERCADCDLLINGAPGEITEAFGS